MQDMRYHCDDERGDTQDQRGDAERENVADRMSEEAEQAMGNDQPAHSG